MLRYPTEICGAKVVMRSVQLQDCPHERHFVVHIPTGKLCGEVYYTVDQAQQRAELNIRLLPEFQGRGLAQDAVQTLVALIFALEPRVEVIWAEPAEENAAAQKLCERCGLTPRPRPPELPPGRPYWELRRKEWIPGWRVPEVR